MRAGLDPGEGLRPKAIDLDCANRIGFPGIFRAVLLPLSRGADPADEIKPGIN
jgi:hypothetical protein